MRVEQSGARAGEIWLQPVDLDQALAHLQRAPATVLAGGTDLYPAAVGGSLRGPVLDLSAVAQLQQMSMTQIPERGDASRSVPGLRIGAGVTWSQLLRASLPDGLQALHLAAREIGGVQIQNRGTVGGNLCNASPAADSVPVLLALDASVEFRSSRTTRILALSEFIVGNRRTVLAPDELLTAVLVPLPAPRTRSLFLKFGHRRYLVISAVSVAISARFNAQRHLEHCAIAVGACSVVPTRLPGFEQRLIGIGRDDLLVMAGQPIDTNLLDELAPIDDVRGSANFRRALAGRLLARGLFEMAGE